MEGWRRRAGVRSISIACLSTKKIIINFNYYLRHEILIDFSYQTKSSSGTLPYYQKIKVANSFTGGHTGEGFKPLPPPLFH